MSLYFVQHKHTAETCPARDPAAGAMDAGSRMDRDPAVSEINLGILGFRKPYVYIERDIESHRIFQR